MENRDKFDSIKKESVRSIFDAIARKNGISRAEIAEQTGLSLMTVGKVADAFLTREITVQVKETRVLAGRRAGLVSLNRGKFAVILDLTVKRFLLLITDMMLDVTDKMEYEYNPDFYFEENLYIFLKNVKIYILRHLNMSDCMGIGIAVPGAYDDETDTVSGMRMPELRDIKLKSIVEDILKEPVSVISEDIVAAAISNTIRIPGYREKTVFYLSLCESICGAVVSGGVPLFGSGAGDLGHTVNGSGRTLEERMPARELTREQRTELSTALYNMMWLINPDVILIENRRFAMDDSFPEQLQAQFRAFLDKRQHKIPEIVISDEGIRHANLGIALKIRSRWMERVTDS